MNTLTSPYPTNSSNLVMPESRWDKILNNTSNLRQPGVERSVLPEHIIAGFKRDIMDVIRFICQKQTDAYGFRVYVDGKKVSNDFLKNTVYPVIPVEGDDGQTWLKDVFEDQKFGIILNYSEKFSLSLANQLSLILEPLLSKIGIPSSGMHTTVFIGNYGFTPLGIHQDHYGANVIHFHLGPGDKIMYTWDANLYEENNLEGKALEETLPLANHYPFGAGDLYFMPWDQYHIGRTDDISIGLTVWFDNHSNKALLDKLLNSIHLQFYKEELTEITRLETDLDHLNYDNIDKIFTGDDRASSGSFKELLRLAFKEFKLALFSNRGWRGIPITIEQVSDFKVEENYFELRNRMIQVPYPFRLYHTVVHDEITVYARGAKIILKYHPHLDRIIKILNENQAVNTDDLLDQLSNVWPQEAGLYFLAMIYNKRGFDIIS